MKDRLWVGEEGDFGRTWEIEFESVAIDGEGKGFQTMALFRLVGAGTEIFRYCPPNVRSVCIGTYGGCQDG